MSYRSHLIDALARTTSLKLLPAMNAHALAALVRAQAELAYLGERTLGSQADEDVIRAALRSLRNNGRLPFADRADLCADGCGEPAAIIGADDQERCGGCHALDCD